MKNTTRIYRRFEYWSVADCACAACLYWQGKRHGCRLEKCNCADIRQEAARREAALHSEARPCRA